MTNLVKLAESGNAEAQYELSVRYFYGDGVPQDYATAIMWIHKAAAQGLVEAQFDSAGCYERGDVVEQNYYTAFDWYQKAAHNGHSDAMAQLGLYYCLGQGCNEDFSLALAWWKKAADLGNANAIYNLGVSYAEGKIIKRNLSKAKELFLRAEELGCEAASSALANLDDEDEYNDNEPEFYTNEFTYSIDIASKIYQKLTTQEQANKEFYKQVELFLHKNEIEYECVEGCGVAGFGGVTYKGEQQTISVLVKYNNEVSVYGIVLPTYYAYTRQLFEEGLRNKCLFGLPIFTMKWYEEIDRAFIYFINRQSYLEYNTPKGRMEKELFGF